MHPAGARAISIWIAIAGVGLVARPTSGTVCVHLPGCSFPEFRLVCGYAAVFASRSAMLAYRRAQCWFQAASGGVFPLAGLRMSGPVLAAAEAR